MHLNIRQKEILQKCMTNTGITVNELEKEYKVSRRTIYHDITCIKDWAIENQIKFNPDSKRIFEFSDEENADKAKNLLKGLVPFLTPLNQCSRTNLILSHLLFDSDAETVKEICENIGISRSTFYRDLDAVTFWLEPFGMEVEIKKNKGIQLCGPESKRREAMVFFIRRNFDSVDLLNILETKREDVFFSNEKDYIYEIIRTYFSDANIQLLVDGMDHLKMILKEDFSDYHSIYFMWLVLVSYQRSLRGCKIENGFCSKIQKNGVQMIRLALEKFDFQEEELYFLLFHFETVCCKGISTGEADFAIECRIMDFIERLSGILECPLIQDELLVESLKLHIQTTIKRLKMGIKDINPIKDDVKNRYPELFHICGLEINGEQLFGETVGEDEISYIVIYLVAAMERLGKNKKRVYAVCTTGKGNAQLLEINLKKHFPDLDVAGTISIQAAMKLDSQAADAVISTTYFDNGKIPVICVSPLMLPGDISKIKRAFHVEAAEKKELESEPQLERDSFFEVMYSMTDCAAAVEELTVRLEAQLSNRIYIALLIHLMMQLHQSRNQQEIELSGLDRTEMEIYKVVDKLYRKYGKYISRYDLDSIQVYIQSEEEM